MPIATMMLITTLVVSFCKDGRVNVIGNLWYLVVCVRCEVLCHFVIAGGHSNARNMLSL